MFKFDLVRHAAALACTLVVSSLCMLAAVGPATATATVSPVAVHAAA